LNYFEHHIGDYLRDTAHLSLLEHGVYRRLIDVYYTRESAIPEKEVARLIAARSKDEREALAAVLAEFFVLIDGAYTQKRCEEELHVYRESQEGAEDKKVNDKERQRRARERRKALFEQLRSHNIVPPWDTKTADLQTLLSRVTKTAASEPVTQPVTRDNTATQTPVPSPQTPNTREKKDSRAAALAVADLVGSGLTEQTAVEFLALRKRKGAPLTERAWQGICTEAERAGWSNEQAVCKSLARGWTGFEAAWVQESVSGACGAAVPNRQAALEERNRAVGAQWAADRAKAQQQEIDAHDPA
jgi:uncharacterized protein YdaU (DUF1376 family)